MLLFSVSSPTNLEVVGQVPTMLAVDAGGLFWIFCFWHVFSLVFLSLSERRPDID